MAECAYNIIMTTEIIGLSHAERRIIANVVKYCAIIVSTVPAVVLYLFMQKYFVKGVMIGSIKG